MRTMAAERDSYLIQGFATLQIRVQIVVANVVTDPSRFDPSTDHVA